MTGCLGALSLIVAMLLGAGVAQAQSVKVETRAQFVQAVDGRTLSRPMNSLRVMPGGTITGRGMVREVSGTCTWRDGYFCRDLFWGGSPMGFNCQEVRLEGQDIRFMPDGGIGDFAGFRLR